MTVQVYLGNHYRTGHERRTFGIFLEDMLERYGDSEEPYLIIPEVEANTASMDMLLLAPHALIMVEFKELAYADGMEKQRVRIDAHENGPWDYYLDDSASHYALHNNPYQQVKRHRYLLRDWLMAHSSFLPGGPWDLKTAQRSLFGWVALTPGFNLQTSHFDLPWDEIKKWFKVLSIDDLAYQAYASANHDLNLSLDQMEELAGCLGAQRCENLQQFIPHYVPRLNRYSFFSRPPLSKGFVDRQPERAELEAALSQPCPSVICLGGAGGIGKTALAAWFCGQAVRQGYRLLWVDCSEREVTIKSLLAAVAAQTTDAIQKSLLLDPEQPLLDKLDVAVEFLEKDPILLVFDDFHKVCDPNGIDALLDGIVLKAERAKVLLTTRQRPACLDNPRWPPGSCLELTLTGLGYDHTLEYIQARQDLSELFRPQFEQIWERTNGNPYAINLMLGLMRNRGWTDQLAHLPVYSDQQYERWIASSIETLSPNAKKLAYRIAILRTGLNERLLERIAYLNKDQTWQAYRELVDQYILEEQAHHTAFMHEYFRDYLNAHSPLKDCQQAHAAAGGYFEKLAGESGEDRQGLESRIQAAYHFEQCGQWDHLLSNAGTAYEALLSYGDYERALTMAAQAQQAAEKLGLQLDLVRWLVQRLHCELELKRLEPAKQTLSSAEKALEARPRRPSACQAAEWVCLESQVWIQRGRYEHLNVDEPGWRGSFQKGLELAEACGDLHWLRSALFRVAQIERYWGEYESARQHFIAAGNIAHQEQDHQYLGMCLSHLALIARRAGDLAEANRLLDLACQHGQQAGDVIGVEIYQGLIGDIALRKGDFARAEVIFRNRLATERKIGNLRSTRITLGWLAEALTGQGRLEEADRTLDQAQALCQKYEDKIGIAWSLRRRGLIQHRRGQIADGNRLIQDGIALIKDIGHLDYLPDFEAVLIKEARPQAG